MGTYLLFEFGVIGGLEAILLTFYRVNISIDMTIIHAKVPATMKYMIKQKQYSKLKHYLGIKI